ncbi:hypothetical protein CANARDRAFT_200418 [[Candida] arabinofermentans NRRL YB-2248]|uniref:BSD domain-containing protein n=1 Tax=[Candida] arabinofermentans NRRL YB-2248 TaxID=983967 RepID=A0A1E4SYT3_9ASCO|nr:hypothetical protein CANARDRAFT_200418 [[Candida] arabinofermentans NRRL YB-2248]
MATVQGTAIYKKKAGTLSILEEEQPPKLQWKCIDSEVASPIVEIELDKIVNLKATTATSERMMLVIGYSMASSNDTAAATATATATPNGDVVTTGKLTFSFNNRITMDNTKSVLQQVIARKRSGISNGSSDPGQSLKSTTPDQPQSNENVENDEFLASLLNSNKLLKNLSLQQRLLRDNPALMKTFTDAVIRSGLEPEEFWSTRVHLLRSYAIQNNQKRGPYNVLSTIKPVASSENQVNVSVTREKIHEIFQQYPIVRKAYDDNVPKINEGEFWSRFFSSKLFRKLRGEKVNLYDRGDITLDKYLYYDPDYDGEEDDEEIDKLLDEKKLATDKPSKKGNTPDITMKVDQNPDLVNVMRTMNRLSHRMMSNIKDSNADKDNLDREFEEELDIKDLETKDVVEYNELKYTQRSNISSNILPSELLSKITSQSSLNPTSNEYDDYMVNFKTQLDEKSPLQLNSCYVDSKKSIYETYKEISNIVKKNAKQSSQSWNSKNIDTSLEKQDAETLNVQLDSLRLTHSTSIEFLRHFWLHFNSISTSSISTNVNFKSELIQLRKLYFSITKCLERVKASLESLNENDKTVGTVLMGPLVESLTCALKNYEASIIESK